MNEYEGTVFRRSTHSVSPRRSPSRSLDLLIQSLSNVGKRQKDKLGDILHAVGKFGPFQKRLVLLTFIPSIMAPFLLNVDDFVFMDQKPYCNTSWILALYPNLTESEQLLLTLPRDPNGEFLTCLMFMPQVHSEKNQFHLNLNNTQPCLDGWIYPKAERRSVINEFDLVCGKETTVDSVKTTMSAGTLLGSIIFGITSDKLGRYPTLLISFMVLVIFGFGTAFARTFHLYLFSRFCVGMAIVGYVINSLSLASEWLMDNHRAHAICLQFCFFSMGNLYLLGLAYNFLHWRLLILVGGAPLFSLIFYIWLLPESPRWLMVKGRVEEAKQVLLQAAQVNHNVISRTLLQKLHQSKKNMAKGSVLDFYNNHYLSKVILVLFCAWFAISFNTFTILLKTKNLDVNFDLLYLVTGIIKVPARLCCIILLDKMGRRLSLGILLMQSCLLSLLIFLLPSELKSMQSLLYIAGHLLQATTITLFFIYSSELFPTVLRATGLSLVMLAMATGATSALMLLSLSSSLLPVFLCCFFSFLALSLCCMLPEVKDQPLCDFLEHLPKRSTSLDFIRSLSLDSSEDLGTQDMSDEVVKNTFINAIMCRFSKGTIPDSSLQSREEDT
ncbi:solute carrier family 22 member 14 [Suncus etruscus]|uniref:solute carrier family 22 member 14 n=1 Tax=Suncus etruscus TaxID=109475 RepID=UPI00210FFFC0|nr:solute carrier family 22 member 14 [Suncus etruscus]